MASTTTTTTSTCPLVYRLLPFVAGIVLVAATFLIDLLVAGRGATAPVQAAGIVSGCALAVLGVVSRRIGLGAALAKVSLLVLSAALFTTLLELTFRLAGHDFTHYGQPAPAVPIYYRRPTLHAGEGFFRRHGPDSWHGKPLSAFLSLQGIPGELYGDERPVLVEYDALGFRNPPGLTDWEIAVAGDSFVELGFLPYDQLFTTHLAKRLGLRVKNLGVSHTGPLSQEFYLRNYGKAPSTREAVLCFFEGNDFYDIEREIRHSELFRTTGRTLVREREKQTSLLRAVHDLIARRRSPIAAATTGAGVDAPGRLGHNAWFRAAGTEWPMTVGVTPPVWDRLTDDQRSKLVGALTGWAETARANGLRPWVVCIPDGHRVFHGYIRYADPESEFARWRPGDFAGAMGRVCRGMGLEFVDPYPELRREVEAGRPTYNLLGDTHLNALGSRVMGEVLAGAIEAAGGR